MIRLDRTGVKVIATWASLVERAFPDVNAFWEKAEAFEKLDLDHPDRRAGFRTYASAVLPKGRKGNDFKALWGRAKRALAAMSYQKCSYCETPINAERSAAVEHFKPKSLFPSLAYDWDNYFLGCGGCNGAKSDKWPAGGQEYLRPDEGDPSTLFVFLEDGTVKAAEDGGPADLTIKDLDLNREWLCNLRAVAIQDTLAELLDLLKEEAIPDEVRERLVCKTFARLGPKLAYSAALRQCFLRVWHKNFRKRLPGERSTE